MRNGVLLGILGVIVMAGCTPRYYRAYEAPPQKVVVIREVRPVKVVKVVPAAKVVKVVAVGQPATKVIKLKTKGKRK